MSLISDERLVQVQAISGLSFSSFLGLHLTNTIFAHSGPHGYDGVMAVFREFYQHPIIEPLLLASLAVHQASSVMLIFRRMKRSEGSVLPPPTPSLAVKLHRYSGYLLGTVIAGRTMHFIASVTLLNPIPDIYSTRGHKIFFGEAADFSLITFSLKHWPFFFYPYYIAFGASGVYHLIYGTSLAVARLFHVNLPLRRGTPAFYATVAAISLSMISALAAFGGLYFPVQVEREAFFRRVYEMQFPAFLLPWKKQ